MGEALEQHGHEVQYFGMEHEGRCVGNRVNLFDKHRDATIIASLGYIPAIGHLLQHSRRSARRVIVLCGDEGKKVSVKLDEIVIYWER